MSDKGWYKHSKEHGLAAKGIPTKNDQNTKNTPVREPQTQNPRKRNERKKPKRDKPKINARERNDPQDVQEANEILGVLSKSEFLSKKGLKPIDTRVIEDDIPITYTKTTGIPQYDDAIENEDHPLRDYDVELVDMDSQEFLKKQYYITRKRTGSHHPSYDYWNEVSETGLRQLYDHVSKGKKIRPFYIEYDERGHLIPYNSSPTKALLTTYYLNKPNVKVYVMTRRSQRDKVKDTYGENSKEYRDYIKIEDKIK